MCKVLEKYIYVKDSFAFRSGFGSLFFDFDNFSTSLNAFCYGNNGMKYIVRLQKSSFEMNLQPPRNYYYCLTNGYVNRWKIAV